MCAVTPRHLGKGAKEPPPFHPPLVWQDRRRDEPSPHGLPQQHFGAAPRPKSLRALWKPEQETSLSCTIDRTLGDILLPSGLNPCTRGIRTLDGDQKGDVGSPLGTPSTNISVLDHEQETVLHPVAYER